MIKKIVLRDVASYDHDGVTFDNLARVNFIYGGNGTGKTTLTRVLDNPSAYPQCSVEWEGETVRVLVFNYDFRKLNFQESIPGVFALGAEGVNSSRELEELRRKRVELGKDAKRVKDRIDRVKHRIEVENGRLADNIGYIFGSRYSWVYNSEECKSDKYVFTERIRTLVKNDDMGYGLTRDDMWKLYRECFDHVDKPVPDKLKQLIDISWKMIARECRTNVYFHEKLISSLNDDLAYWEEEHRKAMNTYEETVALIEGREKELTSVLPTIDRINRMLEQSHLTGFSIQPSPAYPNYYQIQREDGSFVNDTLSEGEANFIAFLYFYQLAVGNNLDFDIGSQRVLVIDDPMSSMDSDVMMIVSTMMREIAGQGIEQMFVLTHNVEFLKQVAPRQRRNDVHYWRLVKDAGISKALDCGHDKPVRSGYELLWEELREERDKMDSTRLQNLMRSIIETYFVKFGDYNKRKLFEGRYMATPDDRTATQAFCKWLDDGSHGPIDDLYAADPLMTNRHYMEEFKRFFALMGQGGHYNMMMRVD